MYIIEIIEIIYSYCDNKLCNITHLLPRNFSPIEYFDEIEYNKN